MLFYIQIRRLSLIKKVANYGKQKKYRGQLPVTYGELLQKEKDEADKKAMMQSMLHKDTGDIYLPIQDYSREGMKKYKQQKLSNQFQILETIEEKIFKINMPRYYGWKSLILNELQIPYNSLTHAQHVTRTHIVKESGLPAYYDNIIPNEQLDNVIQEIKGDVEDNIIFEYCKNEQRKAEKEKLSRNNYFINDKIKVDRLSEELIQKINKIMRVHLLPKYPHLLHAEVDYMPRLEASWFFGGLEPTAYQKAMRKGNRYFCNHLDEPVTMPIQYNGQPVMHLRHKHPLREIVPLSECENPDFDVPVFEFNPQVLSYRWNRQHLTNIPGFWPGDKNEFGFLSYHDCTYLKHRPKEYNDSSMALSVQAILASYSWLFTQACYQGFSTYNDITYPLTTQTVITDGQWWSFFVYQLNTTLLHNNHIKENPKRNICWITEPMKLFDKIENEKLHGLNEDVLKILVKFYANAPEERQNVNLKPYLGESVKMIADIEHDERRNWLENQYKHLMCNRSRHRRIPEIYDWQKIYMIRHKTRPFEKRREPWQFGINIFRRRLDDHTPRYVPKILRENPKKNKMGRWANTYYP